MPDKNCWDPREWDLMDPEDVCNAVLGASGEVGSIMVTQFGYDPLVIQKDSPMSAEYNPKRIVLEIDGEGIIVSASQG